MTDKGMRRVARALHCTPNRDFDTHVVHNPMKMEKSAEPSAFGSFPLKATCTQAMTPTMLAGINLDVAAVK